MNRRARSGPLVALLFATLGCGRPAEDRPADTGARGAALAFFNAVGCRDWGAAHAALDSESQKSCSRSELTRRGDGYLRHCGFDTFTARMSACEERGDEATAHLVLTGRGHGRRDYKEAVVLVRRGGKWGVIMPPKFGKQ